jgi:hypothetical protein
LATSSEQGVQEKVEKGKQASCEKATCKAYGPVKAKKKAKR